MSSSINIYTGRSMNETELFIELEETGNQISKHGLDRLLI